MKNLPITLLILCCHRSLGTLVVDLNESSNEDIWQYGLWSFQMGGTKLEIFLPKNQHTQMKLLNFEFWINGELSKSAKI